MTDSTSAPAYGGRFFDGLQRLTRSTWGFNYADLPRVRAMDREQILAVLSKRHDLDWILRLDSSSPEEFARAIVRDGLARSPDLATDATLLLTILPTSMRWTALGRTLPRLSSFRPK